VLVLRRRQPERRRGFRTPWVPFLPVAAIVCCLVLMASLPIEMAIDQNGNHIAIAPQQLVSRVKIPPPLVFQVMRNLNTAMDQYEAQYGKIPDFLSGPPPAGS